MALEPGMSPDPYTSALRDANPSLLGYEHGVLRFGDPQEALTFALWVAAAQGPLSGLLCLPMNEEEFIPSDRWLAPGEFRVALDATQASQRTVVMVLRSHEPDHLRRRYLEHYRRIIRAGLEPDQVILWQLCPQAKGGTEWREPVSDWREPWNHECFWEYLAACYLRRCGYIVTTWHPLADKNPDLCAYYIPELAEALRCRGVGTGGCFDLELSILHIFGRTSKAPVFRAAGQHGRTVVVEAESRDVDRSQIEGYLQSGYFEQGYVCLPDHPEPYQASPWQDLPVVPTAPYRFGIISNGRNGKVAVSPSKEHGEHERVCEALNEFSAHLKTGFSASNLTFRQLVSLTGTGDMYMREVWGRIQGTHWPALLSAAQE